MQNEQLIQFMSKMVDFSPEEYRLFLQKIIFRKYKKHSFLLQEGKICESLFFINKGLTRAVNLQSDSSEFTQFFSAENSIVTEPISFISKCPSNFSIQCIENCEIIEISRQTIEFAYKNISEGNKFGRLVAERYFILFMNHTIERKTLSILQQYNNINSNFPNIQQRVSQRMIASYLGITSIHLSRLKSKKQ